MVSLGGWGRGEHLLGGIIFLSVEMPGQPQNGPKFGVILWGGP